MKWLEHELPNGRVGLVSICDAQLLLQHRWHVTRSSSGRYYMATSIRLADGRRGKLLFHNAVYPDAEMVDHIERTNTLDNRRSNLRRCTRSQNMGNTGPRNGRKYKGVFRSRSGKFFAQVDSQYLGTFSDEVSAALAYDSAARIYFGECAFMNFPREGERGLYPDFHSKQSAA